MENPFRQLINWLSSENESTMRPEKAMSLPPFWYGVNKITSHFSRLPVFIKRQLPRGGQDKQKKHWAYDLLLTRPNSYQTADVFKQMICGHAICWGNGRAVIVNRGTSQAELIPLPPDRTITQVQGGVKMHFVRIDNGDELNQYSSEKHGNYLAFDDRDVIHVQGFGFDGIEGIGLVSQMKRALGIPIEQESHAYSQTKKGFVAKMIVEAPAGMLTKESDAKEWIEGFNRANSSADNAGRAALLRNGMKATALSMSNSDSQFLEQRRFSRQDIVLMLGLDGMPGDGDSHSYNSKVMESLNYLDTGLAPWLCKLEMQIDDKILTKEERAKGFFSMFDLSELLRTDPKTQAEIHSLRLASRVYNANECREELGRNPYVGGDEYLNPAISQSGASTKGDIDSVSSAAESQLRHMIRVESRRVLQHAGDKNFLAWMEGWYANWHSVLSDKLIEIGIDSSRATEHCNESMKMLVEATDSKPEEFKLTLESCVADWEDRVRDILKGKEVDKCLL